ncbi:hypothetical protein D3C76_1265790 [compost metagenome]
MVTLYKTHVNLACISLFLRTLDVAPYTHTGIVWRQNNTHCLSNAILRHSLHAVLNKGTGMLQALIADKFNICSRFIRI